MSEVEVRQLRKTFGSVAAVDGVDFNIGTGEFVSLLGPSGCGKSTTLRMIAGLEDVDTGSVLIGDREVTGLPTYRRNVGMVFQNYALFPHMTVFENVAFGLRMRNWKSSDVTRAVSDALDLVQLPRMERRFPRQLSGGQQQRVALARAVVVKPSVLLLDEPLSNLDLRLRMEMRYELRKLQVELGITTIFVTHDQGEALNLSDRVIVMRGGKVVQNAAPEDIYERPADEFVAGFIGESNIFDATVVGVEDARLRLRTGSGWTAEVKRPDENVTVGSKVRFVVRPEALRLFPPTDQVQSQSNSIQGRVDHVAYGGANSRYIVQTAPGDKFIVDAPNRTFRSGDEVAVSWSSEDTHVIESRHSSGG